MWFGQRFALYGGLGLVAFGSVGLSVVLTRLYSAALGHHLAFLAVSLALFGVGLGGGLVALFPWLVRPPNLFSRMALFAGLASATTVVTLIRTLECKPPEALDATGLGKMAVLYAVSALPFTLSGVVVAGALKHARGASSRLYFADMVGAAAGGAASLGLLRIGAPRAGLAIAVVFGLASVVLALGARQKRGPWSPNERRKGGWAAAAFFCSSLSLFAGDHGEQWLTVRQLRFVNLDRAQFVAWNELALVTVDRPISGMAWMRMDASAATAILSAKTPVPKHPVEMGYVLSEGEQVPSGPTLVIGAGGGREVRAAISAGRKEIVAVEINRTIAHDVMLGKMREFSGGLYAKPEVRLVVDDGRSFVRSSDTRFQYIVLSLVDTWAASSVGGLSLSEDGLYTVESFRDLIAHLQDDGVLVVNRWDAELDRLLTLSSAALLASGASDPQAHLFGCSFTQTSALLVKKTPLLPEQLDKLRTHCKSKGFVEVFAPDLPAGELRSRLVADPWRTSKEVRGRDVSPPTDQRPFFFYNVPPRELWSTIADRGKLAKEQHGLLTVLLVLLVSAAFALLFLVLPMVFRPGEMLRATGRWSRVRLLGFFCAIGAGFALVEIGLAQILTTFLGHPVYALSAVLSSLLLSVGVGSFLVRRVPVSAANIVAARRAQILTILLAILGLGLLPTTSSLIGLPFSARVAIAVGVAAAVGVLMGALTPLAVSIAATRSSSLVAWGWALNGFFGVTATALAMLVAMHIGYSFVLLLGGVAYFIASAIVPPAAPRGTLVSSPTSSG